MRTKLIFYISILMFGSILSACSSSANEKDDAYLQYLNIGTAGTGGAYYPIGITVSEILSNELDLNTSAQVTGGALDNIPLTNSGEVDLAITQGPMALASVNGEEPFAEKNENISTLFNELSRGIFHLVVLNSSSIDSIADLKGKKVVLGPSGGGSLNMVSDILSVYGLSLKDIESTYVSYSEGVTMLSDRNVDAVLIQSAAPTSAITELAATTKEFKVLSIEKDEMEVLLSEFSYLSEIELPKEMYGTEENIKTVYLTNMMIVRNDLSEDFVYKLTEAIFENISKVQESHPSASNLSLENQANEAPIPLHPGAERYFKEKGIID